MELNDETLAQAREVFLRNPFWRGKWDGAPEGARKRLNLSFWFSEFGKDTPDLGPYRRLRDETERALTEADLNYLIEHDQNKAAQRHFKELLRDLRCRAILEPARLDEAVDRLLAGAPAAEREAVEATRRLFRQARPGEFPYEWLWRAVGGDGEKCLLVGDILNHGHGVPVNAELAFFWFNRAARCGNGEACYWLATHLEDAASPRFDMEAAKFWFAEGLRRRDPVTQYQLGRRLTFGEGPWETLRRPEAGVRLLEMAETWTGDGYASYFLGECYEKGVGVARSIPLAKFSYGIAKGRGCVPAQEALERLEAAGLNADGRNTPQA